MEENEGEYAKDKVSRVHHGALWALAYDKHCLLDRIMLLGKLTDWNKKIVIPQINLESFVISWSFV